MTIPWGDVLQTQHLLESHFSSVKVWDRDYGNYRELDFGNANIVVFMLPGNKFAYAKDILPSGVHKELLEAIAYGKQIYIAYTTKTNNKLYIYEARVNGGIFEGLSGTVGSIFAKHAKHRVPTLEEKTKAAAEQIAINSRYGVADRVHIDHIELPNPTRVYAQMVSHTQWDTGCDERLLLMM